MQFCILSCEVLLEQWFVLLYMCMRVTGYMIDHNRFNILIMIAMQQSYFTCLSILGSPTSLCESLKRCGDDSQCLCIYYIKEKIFLSIKLYSNDSAFYSDCTHIFRFLMRCVCRKILTIKERAPRRSYFIYFRRTAFFQWHASFEWFSTPEPIV
jgi:hypothetical protein